MFQGLIPEFQLSLGPRCSFVFLNLCIFLDLITFGSLDDSIPVCQDKRCILAQGGCKSQFYLTSMQIYIRSQYILPYVERGTQYLNGSRWSSHIQRCIFHMLDLKKSFPRHFNFTYLISLPVFIPPNA